MPYKLNDLNEYSKMRGRKIIILPTEEQKERLQEMAYLYNKVYNWTLNEDIEYYNEHNTKPLVSGLFNKFRDLRNSEEGKEYQNIPVTVGRFAILQVMNESLHLFFLGVNKFPKFKEFDPEHWSFKVPNEQLRFYITPTGVRIQGIEKRTLIPVQKHIIDDRGKFYNVTVKRDRDVYTISMNENVDDIMAIKNIEFNETHPKTEPIGIDVGVINWITCSNGMVFNMPDLNVQYNRLSKLQRRIQLYDNSNDYESMNQIKRRKEYKDLCNRIHNNEITSMQMAVASIINLNPKYIVREDLASESMRQSFHSDVNFKLDRAKFGMLHDWIDNRAKMRDIPVYKVSRWYPSSQICSGCGHRNHKSSSRLFTCSKCGLTIDRDLNASINLRNADISELSPCNGVMI